MITKNRSKSEQQLIKQHNLAIGMSVGMIGDEGEFLGQITGFYVQEVKRTNILRVRVGLLDFLARDITFTPSPAEIAAECARIRQSHGVVADFEDVDLD